jgi:protein CWC15
MTTAHKPTFHPAVGSQHMGGFRFIAPRQQVAVRDLNAHTTLKFRYASSFSLSLELANAFIL